METKCILAATETKADAPEGAIRAVFSTFDEIDRDGDIVLASAFTHGQQVPLTWAHRWDMPIGKGTVLVEAGRAVFDGALLMETQAGQEAYRTIKGMGDLQQYSWGFRVVDAAFEQRADQFIRVIKRAEVFEVSPVLVGANSATYTLGIKSHQPYADHAEAVLAAVRDLAERSKSLADLRAKEGRMLSDANRRRLQAMHDAMVGMMADLSDMLEASESPKSIDAMALYVEYQRTVARLNGAA